MKSKKVEVTHT